MTQPQNQLTGDGTAANRPALLRGDGRPLKPGHHLDTHRGKYRLRCTVDGGRFYQGTRLTMPLHTDNRELAEMMRDAALLALKLAGCLARDIQFSNEPEALEPMDAKTIR